MWQVKELPSTPQEFWGKEFKPSYEGIDYVGGVVVVPLASGLIDVPHVFAKDEIVEVAYG